MRRPAPLIAAPLARLAAYALLAAVGALQWTRFAQDVSAGRALAWVLAGALAGAAVIAAGRLPARWAAAGLIGAALAGALLAVAVSGLDLAHLRPRNWDALALGLYQGMETLNTVRLPYGGRDPWVLTAVEMSGALLCWGAAVTAAWPGPRTSPRLIALALLLVLVATPVVSMGGDRPVWLGLAVAALTAAFLWLERVQRRPGLGLAVLLLAALAFAVPLGSAADREEPWFDYRAFSERITGGPPISFDWDHGYGPIDWPREGAEVLHVKAPEPMYWKAEQLMEFDGREWRADGRLGGGGERPEDDVPGAGDRRGRPWTERFTVRFRRLRSATVVGAGTVLEVTDASRPVRADPVVPGRWVPAAGRGLSSGDSYRVRAWVPRPTPRQLAAATVGGDPRRRAALTMHMDYRPDAYDEAPRLPPYPGRPPRPITEAEIAFQPFEHGGSPLAAHRVTGEVRNGDAALRSSYYDRTWALARRLRRQATSPYDYVVRVNSLLRGPGFRYTEVPPRPRGPYEPPLEAFLFDTRLGYCQQYSGAMALLLRMGGIPARVATGFSPGGFRQTTGEWVVRDTDAHSWVEAWFDGIGWVAFDPTPPQTPARSQVAAIDPTSEDAGAAATPGESGTDRPARRAEGATRAPEAEAAGGPDGGASWTLWVGAAGGLLAALAAVAALAARRRDGDDPEAMLRELERALRRSGRRTPAATTLSQLERRFGTSGDAAAYLRKLRAARYGARPDVPTGAERAGLRRELAAGLGWSGRLRALWALPPRVYPPRR